MGFGMSVRAKRFTLLCEDGVVQNVAVDEGLHSLDATAAEKFVARLKPADETTAMELSDEQTKAAGFVGVLLLALGGYASTDAGAALFGLGGQ